MSHITLHLNLKPNFYFEFTVCVISGKETILNILAHLAFSTSAPPIHTEAIRSVSYEINEEKILISKAHLHIMYQS